MRTLWLLLALLLTLSAKADEVKLLPGMRILVLSEESPTIAVERTVAADGMVELPGVGLVPLAGRTAGAAAKAIAALARVRQGSVTVYIIPATSAHLLLTGAIEKPGFIPWRKGYRLKDILSIAKSRPDADLENVIVRDSTGHARTVDATTTDIALQAGDHIIFDLIKGSNEVLVLGGVNKPGSLKFTSGITPKDAILEANGLAPRGLPTGIKLLRDGKELAQFDLESEAANQKLARGDVIVVPTGSEREEVSVLGHVGRTGLVEHRKGLTLTEAIKLAGGLLPGADLERVEVRRIIGPTRGVRKYSLTKIDAGKVKDPVLEPGDVVVVSTPKPRPENPGRRPVVPPAP